MNSFQKNILRIGPCFVVFILPLIYFGDRIYPHISSKPFFFYGFVEILTGFLIYNLVIDKSYRLSKKTLLYFLPLISFLIWMTFSGILAVNPNLSFWSSLSRGTGLLTLYHSLLFSFIIASLIKHEGKSYIYKLLKWFITGGFILALSIWFGSGGFNLPYKLLKTDGGGGLTGNSSVAATYLIFILAFGAFLLTVKDMSRKTKWFIGVAMATILFSPIFINVYGLLTGGSLLGNARGALLGIIAGIGATGAGYLCLSSKKVLRILGIFSIILSIIIFCFGWRQLVTPNTYLHQKFTEVASGTRFIFWDTAQQAMNERPWLGYGPENQMIAFQKYFNPKILLAEYNHEGWTDRFHNIYYDTGASLGYPGIALYTFFILSIVFALYKLNKKEILSAIEASIFFGLVIGYVFQNLFFFDSTLSLMVLFAFSGIAYALHGITPKEKDKNNTASINPFVRKIIAFILILLCILSLGYFYYKPSQKLSAFGRVFSKPINKPFDELLGGSSVGDAWDVGSLAHDTFKALSLDAIRIKNNKEVLPYIEADLTNLLKYLEVIAEKNPNDLRLYLSMVNLYNTKTFFTDIPNSKETNDHLLDLLDTAHNLSSTNPEVYWVEAQVYAWSGDIDNIIKSYKAAIAIDPSLSIFHDLLIKFAKKIGNEKLYNEALAQAKKDIPNFTISN